MTQDAEITALEAELTRLTGEARTMPLLRLGKAHAERHWRIGPGKPEALPDLEEGIRAVDEAHGYLPERDAYRGQAAFMGGFLRGTRLTAYPGLGPAGDEKKTVELLEESLAFPNVQPVLACMARFMIGQVLLTRAASGFQSPDLVAAAMRAGGATAGVRADAERAADCFRRVVADSPVPEMTQAAQAMLTMAEVVQTVLSGFGTGLGGFDMGRMLDAVTKMQQFQQSGFTVRMPATGLPSPASIFDFGTRLAQADPLDRPIVVLPGEQPAQEHPPVARPPLAFDLDAIRQDLRKLMSVADAADVYAAIVSLLRSRHVPEFLDEMVALAASVVHGPGETDGTDHLLLAAALHLRDRRDFGASPVRATEITWAETPRTEASQDAQDAATSLVAAARKLSRESPERLPVLAFFATLLPGGVPDGLAEQFADVVAAVRSVGADALVLPDPAAALRLNAASGLIEAADGPTDGGSFAVIGSAALSGTVTDERVASAYPTIARLIDCSRRGPRKVTRKPVFVANPRGDRMADAADVMLLRRTFYPRSQGLGRLIEDSDGAGTPDEVRAALACSVLHLACGVSPTGALELAGGTELDFAHCDAVDFGTVHLDTVDLGAADAAGGGLAILPPGCLQPLADRLLALGFGDVIGWRHPVPEPIASLMLYLLHAELADNGRSPATAVTRVRRWARDLDRQNPPPLPAGYVERLAQARDDHWTSLVHLGG
ncbi:MAG TPA: hypothetical protein VFU73_14785 [Actinocrinis sp.]|nr:hypothetical protein [Actinocrinis sp.]